MKPKFLASLLAVACVLLGMAELPAQPEPSQSLRGDWIDRIILLPAGGEPVRFVGPDLRVREIRWTGAKASNEDTAVRGRFIFGAKSALQKKLGELVEASREFEFVIYHLVGGKLHRLRFEHVKLTSHRKTAFEWTAARSQAEVVAEPAPPELV